MRQLVLSNLVMRIAHVSAHGEMAAAERPTDVVDKESAENVAEVLVALVNECMTLRWNKGVFQLQTLLKKLKLGSLTFADLRFELERWFVKDVSFEMQSHLFFYIDKNRSLPGKTIWNHIEEIFPEAKQEVHEAQLALAVDLYTACVFHLMRVSEYGLRRIARKLRVTLTDKGKSQPVDYATWDKIITGIDNKITAIRKNPMGPRKTSQLELYSDGAAHARYMKDIWRNNVSHTKKPYKEQEALAACDQVRGFMHFLTRLLSPS